MQKSTSDRLIVKCKPAIYFNYTGKKNNGLISKADILPTHIFLSDHLVAFFSKYWILINSMN